MIFKESCLNIIDNTNIRWVKVFHLYKGFHRKVTYAGFFVKGSARIVEPPRIEYKGFKYKYSLKGDIVRCWLVRTNKHALLADGSITKLMNNSAFIIRKRQDPKSKFLNGPVLRSIKRRKFKTLFKVLV